MSELAAVLAVVLLEVLLLAAVYFGYRRWRRRRLRRREAPAHDASLDPVARYLESELHKAAAAAQGPSPAAERSDFSWERVVALRQAFLSSELNVLSVHDNPAAFWSLLRDGYAELMAELAAAGEQGESESAPAEAVVETVVEKAVPVPDGADLDNLRAVINRQDSAIGALKDQLWNSLEDQEALKLVEEKFQILQTQRKEMENCLSVLEDENNRLYGELSRLQADAGNAAAEAEDVAIKPVEQRERSPGEEQHQIIAQAMTLIGKLPLSVDAGPQVETIRETLHELLDTNARFDKYVAEIEAENQALRRKLEGPAEDRRA